MEDPESSKNVRDMVKINVIIMIIKPFSAFVKKIRIVPLKIVFISYLQEKIFFS